MRSLTTAQRRVLEVAARGGDLVRASWGWRRSTGCATREFSGQCVASLIGRGLLAATSTDADGRPNIACITEKGMQATQSLSRGTRRNPEE